jgi:hypothetical protein
MLFLHAFGGYGATSGLAIFLQGLAGVANSFATPSGYQIVPLSINRNY